MRHEQVRQDVDDIRRVELAGDADRQAFPGELVDDVEHAELPSVVRPALDEIVGPDMVRALWPQTDTGPVIQPEAAFLRLLLRHFQPLPSPDPFDPLDVHRPALRPQHRRDPAIAIAAIPGGEPDDVGSQRRLVSAAPRLLAAQVERCWPRTRQAKRSEMENLIVPRGVV